MSSKCILHFAFVFTIFTFVHIDNRRINMFVFYMALKQTIHFAPQWHFLHLNILILDQSVCLCPNMTIQVIFFLLIITFFAFVHFNCTTIRMTLFKMFQNVSSFTLIITLISFVNSTRKISMFSSDMSLKLILHFAFIIALLTFVYLCSRPIGMFVPNMAFQVIFFHTFIIAFFAFVIFNCGRISVFVSHVRFKLIFPFSFVTTLLTLVYHNFRPISVPEQNVTLQVIFSFALVIAFVNFNCRRIGVCIGYAFEAYISLWLHSYIVYNCTVQKDQNDYP